MPALRVFLAHPKDTLDEKLTEMEEIVALLFERKKKEAGGTAKLEIVTGLRDFNERVMTCGGWDAWAESVAVGTGYRDGVLQPLFDAIVVVPSPIIGMGTAKIVASAINNRKPVFYVDTDGERNLHMVTNIHKRPTARGFVGSHSLDYTFMP